MSPASTFFFSSSLSIFVYPCYSTVVSRASKVNAARGSATISKAALNCKKSILRRPITWLSSCSCPASYRTASLSTRLWRKSSQHPALPTRSSIAHSSMVVIMDTVEVRTMLCLGTSTHATCAGFRAELVVLFRAVEWAVDKSRKRRRALHVQDVPFVSCSPQPRWLCSAHRRINRNPIPTYHYEGNECGAEKKSGPQTGREQSSTDCKHIAWGAARKRQSYPPVFSADMPASQQKDPIRFNFCSPSVVVNLVPTILLSFISLAKPFPSISSGNNARNEILPIAVPSSCCLTRAAVCFKDVLQETTTLAIEQDP